MKDILIGVGVEGKKDCVTSCASIPTVLPPTSNQSPGLEPVLGFGASSPQGSANSYRPDWGSGRGFFNFSLGGLSGGFLDFKAGISVSEIGQQRHENPSTWEGLSTGPTQVGSKTSQERDFSRVGMGHLGNDEGRPNGISSGGCARSSKISMKFDEQKGNKRKKGKTIKESSECPNLIFRVDLQFDSVMATSELKIGRAHV